MQITKHINEDSVDMDFFLPDIIEEWTIKRKREFVFKTIAEKLEKVGRVNNVTKLFHELEEREKKDSCCIGEGIAFPHVKTLQCKELLISILISKNGVDFEAFDGIPIKIFVGFVAPRYDDNLFKQFYKNITKVFQDSDAINELLRLKNAGELIRHIKKAVQ